MLHHFQEPRQIRIGEQVELLLFQDDLSSGRDFDVPARNHHALAQPRFAGANRISRDVSQIVRGLNRENATRFLHDGSR